MKKIVMAVAVLMTAVTISTGYQQKVEAMDMAADATINVDAQQFWREAIQKYREDASVGQLMFVRYLGGCKARVLFYEKNRNEKDTWSLVFETLGVIGKNGLGKTGEGDAKTPIGDFAVQKAFGIKDNPGTRIEYIPIQKTTYACDEAGPYYNQIIDTAVTGHNCGGEEMYKYSPEYNYGLTIDFNPGNVYPIGSAVFIHCIGPKMFTGGCVAIPEENMKQVLRMAEPGMRVIINYD